MTDSKTSQVDDPWARRIDALALQHGQSATGAGRVLSVKFGYNPNSSSVGSVVSMLMWTATAGAMAANVIAALLAARAARPEGATEGDA